MQVDGTELHVDDAGAGPPVLLINGIGAHLGMWNPLRSALAGMRVISFDAPGTGRSPTPALPLGMPALARLAEAVLDRVGVERADVVGYSFGGVVAQRLALQSPRRVRRLVLAATTPGWGGVPGSLRTLAQMSTPLRYYWREYYEATIGDLMGGRARHDDEFVRLHGRRRREHPPDPLGYAWQLAALAGDPGSLGWLHRIAAPALVVTGDDDPVMPVANSRLLAGRLPDARLLVLPGEGHLMLLDPDSPALPAIRAFLATGDRAGAVEVGRRDVSASVDHPVAALSAGVRALWG
jgi:pimeloyl-ACP methyl ester carboxylesterase